MTTLRPMLAAVALACALAQAAYGRTNLLFNPRFSEDLQGWSATGTVRAMQVTEWHSRSPRAAFGMGNDDGPDVAWGVVAQDVVLPDVLPQSARFTFAVWTMAEVNYAGRLSLAVQCLAPNGEVLAARDTPCSPQEVGEWRPSGMTMLAPPRTKTVRVSCTNTNVPTGYGLSFIWIDDAALIEE